MSLRDLLFWINIAALILKYDTNGKILNCIWFKTGDLHLGK